MPSNRVIKTDMRLATELQSLKVKELKQALEQLGYHIPGKPTKDVYINVLCDLFLDPTDESFNSLSDDSRRLMKGLIAAGKGVGMLLNSDSDIEKIKELINCKVVKSCSQEEGTRLYLLDEVYDAFVDLVTYWDDVDKSIEEDIAVVLEDQMDKAKKNEADGKPLVFSPAITRIAPNSMPESVNFWCTLIRPKIMEVSMRLSKNQYLVCYFFGKDNGIHLCCCWGDVLDFVWNGFDAPTPWNPYFEVKKHFKKKYPHIANLFGQKEEEDGRLRFEPYLTTIGWDHQPKKWWLSIMMYDKEFTDLFVNGVFSDNDYATGIGLLRDACVDIYHDIMNSDAKSPKQLMMDYFGIEKLEREDFEGMAIVEDM